jgi:chondroitin 4-sulfotransferase 11
MVNHEYKFVFLHIPKTAGMSIGQTLFDLTGVDEIYEGFRIHHDDLTEDILKEYYVFTFVRNPWDRFYSQYKFREWLRKHPIEYVSQNLERLFIEEYNTNPVGTPETAKQTRKQRSDFYAEFIHLTSQVGFLKGEKSDYLNKIPYIDYIGRFETLQKDFDFICKQIGLPQTTLPYRNKSIRDEESKFYKVPYYRAMNNDVKNQIQKMYQEDITKFGYKFK